MLTPALAALAMLAAGFVLWRTARAEHRAALRWRAGLLAEAHALFPQGRAGIGPDGFPRFAATLPDGTRLGLEVIADTLVTRRLPQLWLSLSLQAPAPERAFSLGALARPTGSEFYALTHALPDWHAPPSGLPLLVRGRGACALDEARATTTFATLFEDATLKEAVATPRGLRIVRQAAQGERAAHLLLRQSRFPLDAIPRATMERALSNAATLRAGLSAPNLAAQAA